ncbi:hypothetical protein BOTBODRAFT_459427 [Botryobasidium botryosum FD-172 SS1]|uniref:Uncharacterized protein n=1 Tax=Botryobasidium botryosum (strain FD-172 SS1) TaxID=930990 RepID=A0A067M9M0_BOTB1|nr:hypothetical protein BOTBODRAFT_459427 [Botryobasidium botryosum FD-172 SS1]
MIADRANKAIAKPWLIDKGESREDALASTGSDRKPRTIAFSDTKHERRRTQSTVNSLNSYTTRQSTSTTPCSESKSTINRPSSQGLSGGYLARAMPNARAGPSDSSNLVR